MNVLRYSFLLLLFSALTGAAWVANRPAERSRLQSKESERKPTQGVLDQLEQAAIKRSAPFDISEARLNEHLAESVTSRPAWGGAKSWWRMEAPEVDLREGGAVLRLRWRLAEVHVCDLTVNLRLKREASEFHCEIVNGAYGRLNVPKGLLHPAKAVLSHLADVLRPELDALFAMNQIQIVEDQLLLDPRFLDSAAQAATTNR